MRKLLFLVAIAALALAACRAEVNLSIDVDESGATVVAAEIGADEEFQQLISAGGGGDPGDLLGEGLDFNLEGAERYERTEDDMMFWGARKEYASFEEMEAELTNPAEPGGPFTGFSFTMDDDGANLQATLSAPEDELPDEELPFDPSQLTSDIFSVNLIFGMPGTVVEHNADQVLADGRLLWEIPLVGGEKVVQARSELGSGTLWWLWVILGVVLLIGIAAAVVALSMSRRQAERAIAARSDAAAVTVTPAEGPPSAEEEAEEPDDGVEPLT